MGSWQGYFCICGLTEMKKKILIILLFMIAFTAIGCGNESFGDDQAPQIDSPDPVVIDKPLLPAREIDRGGEEYDYTGWVNGMAGIDTGLRVGGDWRVVSNTDVGGKQWTDPQNSDAKFIYKDVIIDINANLSPEEAIWDHYGKVIEKGGDVEYGVFNSKYLADAYYVRYVEDGYIYTALYFVFYPQEVFDKQILDWGDQGAQKASALLFENRIESGDNKGTLTEDAFWKAAQGIFIAKAIDEDIEDVINNMPYVPYIPEIDGLDVGDTGTGMGIVP